MQPGQQEGAAMSDDTRSPPLNNVITINHMESGGGGGEVERRLAVRECAPDMGAPPDLKKMRGRVADIADKVGCTNSNYFSRGHDAGYDTSSVSRGTKFDDNAD